MLPTIFTPNGDGFNDEFKVYSAGGIIVKEMKIFNRWGELVHDATVAWNGDYKGKRLQYSKDRWNRKYLSKVLGEKCNSCNIEEWNGSHIGLEVNHIDGHAYNNVIDNLELLCPNCHSQTDTYKNKGARISDRRYR